MANAGRLQWRKGALIASTIGGSLVLATLVVRTTVITTLVQHQPTVVSRLAPGNAELALSLAKKEFALTKGAISPAKSKAAVRAASQLPLSEGPFFIAGVAAVKNQDGVSGLKLLEEARDRNPRSRLTRLLLLDRYLTANRVAEAAAEMTVLTRLIPEAGKILIPQLARLAIDTRTEAALTAVLKTDPDMHQLVLRELATMDTDPALVLRIAERGASTPPSQERAWPSILINRLVEKGQVAEARSIWRALGGNEKPGELVFNGAFRPSEALPPFNWRLHSTSAGVAEIRSGSGLEVEYYGRETAGLADQLLLLPPGKYQMIVDANGSATGNGSSISWSLLCQGSRTPLADIPFVDVGYRSTQLKGSFVVPSAECTSQWLSLIGRSGEFPSVQSATVTRLQVRKMQP